MPVRSSQPWQSPTAVYLVGVEVSWPCTGGWVIHALTLRSGVTVDRVVAAAWGYRDLLAASTTFALVDDGGNVDGSDTLGIVDLRTGTTKILGTLNSFGIGITGPIAGALSPDGGHVAIGSGHKVVVLDVAARSIRTLVTSASGRFFVPIRWTTTGIYADERPYADYTTQFDLVKIDPTSGGVSTVHTTAAYVLSPSATSMANVTHSDLGDAPCNCQFQWQNTLNVGPPSGSLQVVAQEKNHYLSPVDLLDDGEVLFVTDSGSSDGPFAADMGLYVSKNGHESRQLAAAVPWQWGNGALIDSSTALVEKNVGGYNQTAVELVLVHLCPDPATPCTVTTSVVSSTNGIYPTGIVIDVVGPPA